MDDNSDQSLDTSTPMVTDTSTPTRQNRNVQLEYGDIIEIIAPSNQDIHEMNALIMYIDEQKIKVVDIATGRFYQLSTTEDGFFTDESITQINLHGRSEVKGYARQNNLLPKTWIDIHFGGEIPAIITGEITNLEEDMIEVTTYPELKTIYINFGYKGIPEKLPIETIVIREKPTSLNNVTSLAAVKNLGTDDDMDDMADTSEDVDSPSIQFTETGESITTVPEDAEVDPNVRDTLHNLYIDANEIVFGEQLEALKQLVEIPESERRYGIDAQVNDLMDEILSTIPNSQRTIAVIDNLHLLIERFRELRQQFSKFDSHDNVYDFKINGNYYKPLVERIHKLDTKLKWIVPVVSNRKKIYGISNTIAPDVIVETSGEELRAIETLQNAYYDRKNVDNTLTYANLNNRIQNIMMPFENLDGSSEHLANTQVLTSIDAIVDNLGKFQSSVFDKKNEVEARDFVIQRYGLGLSHMDKEVLKTGKTLYVRNNMTPNDNMTVKSLLMLPEPIVKFSTIDLPSTNILERSTLHQNYLLLFKLLNKNADIVPHIISDLSKELDYEQMEKDEQHKFLSTIQEFMIDPNVDIEHFEENEKFKQMLEVIVPKTRFLIRLVRKHVKDKVSFMDVVKKLEPFMVYPSDITYQQYMEIRFFMKERITEIKKQLGSKSKEYDLLRNTKYKTIQNPNSILKLVSDTQDVSNPLFQSYDFLIKDKLNTKLTTQEILMRMNNADNSNMYTNIVTSILISLITPDNITDALATPELDDMTDNEKIKPTDCSRRFLTKKYNSMKELQKDNDKSEVYYDKDFDDTPYDLIHKYKDEQKNMSPDVFHEFLVENLVQIHGSEKDIAGELATTLIAGKKMVRDGEFAILELRPTLPDGVDEDKLSKTDQDAVQIEADVRKKITYYRRLKENWIQDNTIDEEAFLDTNTLFCNISNQCYKNLTNKTCETTQQSSSRFNTYNQQKLLGEFDKRFAVSLEDLQEKLSENIKTQQQFLNKSNMLKDISLQKSNDLSYTIGTLANRDDIIQSPHLYTRTLIMGQSDFSKKQLDISTFVNKFCRNPMVSELDEDPHWMYCKDTNTKLFPVSIYELADTFINNPNNYLTKMDEICKRVGAVSDDGDHIVDKHTGEVIREIDFVTSEEYDDAGFRITSNDIMEKDLGTVVMENIGRKEKRVFENETSETIYNVFSAICFNIDIKVDGLDEFILRVSNEMINANIMKEDIYAKRSAKMEKDKGKKLQPYMNYRNETIIIIVASILLVAIQTAVPSFQAKRTFPGCIRSFSGFPMDGIEDTTGIQYIACVLNKIKSQISPWDAIKKYKQDILANRIKQILEKNIITRNDISDMYAKKREYVLLNPLSVSPEEHQISKWKHFLPPVVDFSVIKNLRTIGTGFKQDLIELIRQGKTQQHESVAVLKSKIIQYGYGIIESINNVVRTKDLLLKTSTRHFVENACCNETDVTNPISYFSSEDESIQSNIRIVSNLGEILQDLNTLTRAPLLYHPEFTGINYSMVSSGDLEDKIYSSIIHYCNFDRDLPVPEIYQSICSERPPLYDTKWTLSDKIEFLKKNGKRYTIEDLNKLMSIVYEKNIVHIDRPMPFNRVTVLKEIINKMDDENSTVIDEPLRKHLMKVLNTYNPKTMSSDKTPELTNLIKYLNKSNKELYKQITAFFDKHGNLSERHFNKLSSFLMNINKWNIDKSMTETGGYYEEGLYSALQFIHNSVYQITKVYPAALLSNSAFFKRVPKHWGVHPIHADDLQKFIDKYYEKLETFKGDNVLLRLLQEVNTRLVSMNAFMQHIPVHTEIVKDIDENMVSFHSLFDKNTIYMLYTYCFYSAIYEYIVCSNDKELERADIQEMKQTRRDNIQSSRNASNDLYSVEENVTNAEAETIDDLMEIQVVAGNRLELKERVCSLLVAFLEIEDENKSVMDLSYEQIMKKVNRSKDKEKNRIISYFGNMTIEERKIEDAFKAYKLGRWNVGQQKGLFQYDPNTYQRERSEMITQLYDENADIAETDVEALDIYELDKLDELDDADDYNRDTYDFQDLGEDYADGDYYPEDRDDDDF